MNEQIKQALAVVKACDGQNVLLVVSGLDWGSWACPGTLHVGDSNVDVSWDKNGWRHSLGFDVALLRSLEVRSGERGLVIEAQIDILL